MEKVISHERDRAFARRTITASDLADWPNVIRDNAGRLEDGRVHIGPTEAEAWPLKLKRLLFIDSRHPSHPCSCFSVSSDGQLLAASFRHNDILVWRLSDGLLVQRLHQQGHKYDVWSLSFSPTDCVLVSGSADKIAIVWDIKTGHVLFRLVGDEGAMRRVIYSPDGALIATGSGVYTSVKIWDAFTGVCLHSFTGEKNSIYDLAFSPDNSYFCVAVTYFCYIHDTNTFAEIARPRHETDRTLSWSVCHKGDRIVDASVKNQVKIWSMATGEELLAIDHPKLLSWPVVFSPDDAEVLAVCDADNTAVTYDSRTGQLCRIYRPSKKPRCAAYSSNGDYVVFGDTGGDLAVYDAKSGTFLATFVLGENDRYLQEIRFISDSQTVLMRFLHGPLRLCNIQDAMRMR
ncbi:uncharacterized protein PHACADRAFT_87103 [Phanerochaete carnosa HHB-10118-sp]|uniref:Uncharacterized protein n=1 Tax=Phanerochaete carnosa (strain HHB-10118-sp) TaxID=650164 RepID=K5WHR0_PHACS|nr:uncharacterized protein PHACADRAFT_87103 [Phanerochaete carnosa HHB-10118-sp]EKM58870.1 hypothetical protein PHACADRAFT_87103 [Phanerochaete carnosa HHB-10118-sp]